MRNYKVLVVEDDVNILMGLEENLRTEGYVVFSADRGDRGLEIALTQPIDLVLLDIMLPVLNGFEVCKKIREAKPSVPIIMLSLAVLLARIRAVLRRAYPQQGEWTRALFADVEIDFKAMRTTKGGTEVRLTPKEYEIMRFFITRRGEVVHRHDMLNEVWGYKKTPSTRTVDNFILDLRKKLEPNPASPIFITSISGVGYRFEAEVEVLD